MTFHGERGRRALLFEFFGKTLLRCIERALEFPALFGASLNLRVGRDS